MRNSPRVHYGATTIPTPTDICLGGRVKLQRLQPFFPDAGERYDLLYLVSSGLPDRWLPAYWRARRDRRRVIWNQSAVSYPAVWPELDCDEDNLLLEQGLHAADFVLYQTEFSRVVADRYLGPFGGPWEVVYNAVDTRFFTPARAAPRPLTLLLGGTQYRLSSLETAISALAALRRRIRDARLIVTGAMCWIPHRLDAMEIAQSRAASLGVSDAVDFAGEYPQASAPALFRRADVLIHTRYDDLCPNVVIEAMACGLPVVYSRTGGTPELVGDAGIGVNPGHSWELEPIAAPELWADAIERVAVKHAAFAEAARQQAVDHFDLRQWIARHARIFEQVMSSPPREPTARVPVNERLRCPLQLLELFPNRVRQGEGFNTQPDGRSAFAISAANATRATLVVVDGEVQQTFFSNPSELSAVVPASFTRETGTHRVTLAEPLRTSNELSFPVDAVE